MVHSIVPTPTTNVSSQELSKTLEAKDNSFVFHYFDMHTHGATTRAMLAYAEADWKSVPPTDWFNVDKPLTKFGTLPILYEVSANGEHTIEIAEALNIELYLGRKFGLLGDNAFEESQIVGFFSNTRALMHRHEDAYFCRSQFREADRDKFVEQVLKQWIRTHEKALAQNGSNGHYIGDKVTLADIKTAVALDSILNHQYHFKGFDIIGKLVTKEATPNIWKVREIVEQKKSYKDWLESKEYKDIATETTSFFDNEYNGL
ncbi:hypothetical protein BGZ76_011551 [Entomortierella beljakovae]|nr:hypothetical protein BGZ76_011551 [Entomortierella beljakovae]